MPISKDKKLLYDLSRVHPTYKKWENDWIRYRDVLEQDTVDIERYLPKGEREGDADYELRKELSHFIPDSPLTIDRLLGGLFNTKPRRDHKGQETLLRSFIMNADRRRHSWQHVVRRIARTLIAYGTTRVLVNIPIVPKGASRAEEKAMGVEPFVINYSPLSVIDWNVDESNTLTMIRIRESYWKPNPDRSKKHTKYTKFIQYERDTIYWWIFAEEDGKDVYLTNSDDGVNRLGMIPMVIVSLDEREPMVGTSHIHRASKSDIKGFQHQSDQSFDAYLHAHPILKYWSQDEEGELGIGSRSYLRLETNPGGDREDAQYIEFPSAAFDALQRLIEESQMNVFRQANMDPMGVVQGAGVYQASGTARAWSFTTSESRVLSTIADEMTVVERHVLDLVLRYKGEIPPQDQDEAYRGDIQYAEEFDMSATSQLLEEQMMMSDINSPTFHRLMQKRIVASKVGDSSAKTIREIFKEIEENPLLGTRAGKSPLSSPFDRPGQNTSPNDEEVETEEDGDSGDNGNARKNVIDRTRSRR